MTLSVEPYRAELRPLAESCLARSGALDPEAPHHAFWQRMLAGAETSCQAFVVAHDGGNGVGLAFALWRPLVDRATRLAMLILPEAGERSRATGRALCAGLMRALEPQGVRRLLLSADDRDPAYGQIATAAGFTHIQSHLRMAWQGNGEPVPEHPVRNVAVAIFRGGDRRVCDEIAALFNRSFAGDRIYAEMSAADVERLADVDGTWFATARETTTGMLVGATEASPSGFFSAIVVARRYWGTGVASWIGIATMNEYARNGRTDLHSLVRASNRPSVALHEREGWKRVGTCDFYLGPPLSALEGAANIS